MPTARATKTTRRSRIGNSAKESRRTLQAEEDELTRPHGPRAGGGAKTKQGVSMQRDPVDGGSIQTPAKGAKGIAAQVRSWRKPAGQSLLCRAASTRTKPRKRSDCFVAGPSDVFVLFLSDRPAVPSRLVGRLQDVREARPPTGGLQSRRAGSEGHCHENRLENALRNLPNLRTDCDCRLQGGQTEFRWWLKSSTVARRHERTRRAEGSF